MIYVYADSILKRQAEWSLLNDIVEGEDRVKSKGEQYLPKLSGQDPAEYSSYNNNGSLYNATGRTVDVLTGLIFKTDPIFENLPEGFLNENLNISNEIFVGYMKDVSINLVKLGYSGVLVDIDNENVPYITIYSAENIVNFRVKIYKGVAKLSEIILNEYKEEYNIETESMEQVLYIRRLFLDTSDVCMVELYKYIEEVPVLWSSNPLIVRGKMIDFIPFVIFNAKDSSFTPAKPILYDLAKLNIQHYRVSADYYHGLHYCAIPTPWLAGFGKRGDVKLGPGRALITDDVEAKCGFLEFTGQGLNAVERALDKIEVQMSILGARFLEPTKKVGQAAQTVERYQSGDSSALSSIVSSMECGFSKVFTFIGYFLATDLSNVTVKLNKEFIMPDILPDEIRALLLSVQAGKLSVDSFLYNLKRANKIPQSRSVQDEKDMILMELGDEDAFKSESPDNDESEIDKDIPEDEE